MCVRAVCVRAARGGARACSALVLRGRRSQQSARQSAALARTKNGSWPCCFAPRSGPPRARELARVGPRHEDGPAATASRTALWINAAAGGAVAYALLGSVARGGALSPPRRLLYATMGSMAGVMLPQAMALAGPAVRRQLLLVLGGDGAGKARA